MLWTDADASADIYSVDVGHFTDTPYRVSLNVQGEITSMLILDAELQPMQKGK